MAALLAASALMACSRSLPEQPPSHTRGPLAPAGTSGASAASCPGPAICGKTCRLDPNGIPIFCSGSQCTCGSGFTTASSPDGGVECQAPVPEVIGSESGDYSCPGVCQGAIPWATVGSIYNAFDLVPVNGTAPGGEAFMPVWGYQATHCGDHGVGAHCTGGTNDQALCTTSADCPGGTCTLVGVCQGGSASGGTCFSAADCAGTCGPKTTARCEGGVRDSLLCDNAHPCPGGTCVPMGFCSGVGALCVVDGDCQGNCLPVGACNTTGQTCSADGDCPSGFCAPIRTWAGCAAPPQIFCEGIQDSDEGDFNPNSCNASEGCGTNFCVADYTSAWPVLSGAFICKGTGDVSDPSRMDFPNNVVVYRGHIYWEDWTGPPFGDDDWTMDLLSSGHEIYDTDQEYAYHSTCPDATHGRVHVEFDSDDSTDHFTDNDWGNANAFWRGLRSSLEDGSCSLVAGGCDNLARCYVKAFVNKGLQCPRPNDSDPNDECALHDPTAVVVGVPGLDCHDDDRAGTDEIHPAYAVAIRTHEDPSEPEQWAFFYRNQGNDGLCGTESYARCLSDFKLPLGLPVVLPGKVLESADVNVEWHVWAQDDSTPTDVTLSSSFDTTDGTVLSIHLPHAQEGVVGLVTITPKFDTTPPTITCPADISVPPDLGKCTAVVTFTPQASDNCTVSTTCTPPSGSVFPLGSTPETCTAIDQAGLPASCTFNVTVAAGNTCPRDEGYWKHHLAQSSVTSLTLGTVAYDQVQLANLLDAPVRGDASIILAKAEITALLNLAAGSNPGPVCAAIAAADSALGGCTLPCGIHPSTTLGKTMLDDANALDSFNSGQLSRGCTP